MGVVKYEVEIISSIPPHRLFKAFILDVDHLFPKVLPQVIKSIKVVEGDGKAGSVKLITFNDPVSNLIKTRKFRIDEIDEEKLVFKYTVIEGEDIGKGIEKITSTVKIEAGPDGGSIVKTVVEYHAKEHHHGHEEKGKEVEKKVSGIFKAIEAHLHAHPREYV